ncbi:MAG TPA: SDR family oxidoreductase [Burkholderiales bacterium]|nr:SDR family oxidoreductase [Burkholderiales bacterium]
MKVAIITGGSSGIGAATARELSKRGWRVAINYAHNAAPAEKLAKDVGNAIAVQADVSLDADCRRLAKAVLDRFGAIDALVNNAGTTKVVAHNDLDGLSAEDFQRIFQLNVVAPFQMVRACAEALKKSGGAVVNVSSAASVLGTGSSVAYAASKAALETMSLSLARSLAPEVRVNVVAPGHTNTPWHPNVRGPERAAEIEKRYSAIAPLKDISQPEDVADAIVWLIEGARRVTGEVIYVDAGMHIAAPSASPR